MDISLHSTVILGGWRGPLTRHRASHRRKCRRAGDQVVRCDDGDDAGARVDDDHRGAIVFPKPVKYFSRAGARK